MIQLRYFARLRETLGSTQERIVLPEGVADVAGLVSWLRARGGAWESSLVPGTGLRVAVNQDMAHPATAIADGDEIAFFPPVTGG